MCLSKIGGMQCTDRSTSFISRRGLQIGWGLGWWSPTVRSTFETSILQANQFTLRNNKMLSPNHVYNLRRSRASRRVTFQFTSMAPTTTRPPSPEPNGPQPIRRLQEAVINRIAAGEASLNNLQSRKSKPKSNRLYTDRRQHWKSY